MLALSDNLLSWQVYLVLFFVHTQSSFCRCIDNVPHNSFTAPICHSETRMRCNGCLSQFILLVNNVARFAQLELRSSPKEDLMSSQTWLRRVILLQNLLLDANLNECRSMTSTRFGFSAFCFLPSIVANSLLTNACCGQTVEAQGCRAQILMSVKTAMEMWSKWELLFTEVSWSTSSHRPSFHSWFIRVS